MSRKRADALEVVPAGEQPQASPPPPLRTVEPHAIGTLAEWGGYLGLPKNCLRREARLGRLVTYRRAGRLWTDGEAVLAWLHAGRVRRRRAAEADQGDARAGDIDQAAARAG